MKFSVLMSVYKSECPSHFNESLISIWDSQTLKPSEIVLVKDGLLSQELDSVVTAWKKKLRIIIKLLEFKENKGLGAALKFGLDNCSFDLVARMDSDDLASPFRFEKQVNFMAEHPEIDILGSYVREMSYSGSILDIRRNPIYHDEILSCLWSCPLIHPSVMLRRSRIIEAGNYEPSCRRRQDYELWFRCAEKGLKFHNLPESLLYYRFGKYTHKKQTPRLAWEQGVIGYRGSSRLGLPLHKRFACFVPFIRSFLPSSVQHLVYKVLSPLDPRRKA